MHKTTPQEVIRLRALVPHTLDAPTPESNTSQAELFSGLTIPSFIYPKRWGRTQLPLFPPLGNLLGKTSQERKVLIWVRLMFQHQNELFSC